MSDDAILAGIRGKIIFNANLRQTSLAKIRGKIRDNSRFISISTLIYANNTPMHAKLSWFGHSIPNSCPI
jgi:hypothetical protein